MVSHPLIGVLFHWLGGLSCAAFYLPYRGVRKWSWETYWLTGGIFSWVIAPWVAALLLSHRLFDVLYGTPWPVLGHVYLFGVLWGFGGLTFGLTMRYLGISLGMAIALSFCSFFGTMVPPIFAGELYTKIIDTSPGLVILLGVLVCLGGIGLCGIAGVTKEREMSTEQKRAVIKEFNFKKGILLATFSGIMSSCFAYGLDAGVSMNDASLAYGTDTIWAGLPRLVVLLLGGLTTNGLWCVLLHILNRTGGQYISSREIPSTAGKLPIVETAIEAPAEEMARAAEIHPREGNTVPLATNYLFCALAGTLWYGQFFFYTIGESQMGLYKFSSWSIHMASIIIFSTLLGIAFAEWRGSSRKAMELLTLGLIVLVASTMIIGYGNYMATLPGNSAPPAKTDAGH
jgi:L-rhamnose-H+ transport protein